MNDNAIGSDIIAAEMKKHGIAPNEKKEISVTDCNAVKPDVRTLAEREEIETKIKKLQRGATYTYKVSGAQMEQLERLAAGTGRDWKQELTHQLETKVFDQKIGIAKIERPSWGSKVTGPSNGKHHLN